MEETAFNVLRQIPAVAVIAFLVVKFLKHLEIRDAFLRGLQDDARKVQDQATDALRENTQVLSRVEHYIKSLNERD